MEDLFHPIPCITDDECPFRTAKSIEVGATDGGPSPFFSDLAEHPLVARKVVVPRLFGRSGERAERVDADL